MTWPKSRSRGQRINPSNDWFVRLAAYMDKYWFCTAGVPHRALGEQNVRIRLMINMTMLSLVGSYSIRFF